MMIIGRRPRRIGISMTFTVFKTCRSRVKKKHVPLTVLCPPPRRARSWISNKIHVSPNNSVIETQTVRSLKIETHVPDSRKCGVCFTPPKCISELGVSVLCTGKTSRRGSERVQLSTQVQSQTRCMTVLSVVLVVSGDNVKRPDAPVATCLTL